MKIVLNRTQKESTCGVQHRPSIPPPLLNPHKRRYGLATATREDCKVVLCDVRMLSKDFGSSPLPAGHSPTCTFQLQQVVRPHGSSPSEGVFSGFRYYSHL